MGDTEGLRNPSEKNTLEELINAVYRGGGDNEGSGKLAIQAEAISIGDVIIDMPGIWDKLDVFESSIADGNDNISLTFSNVTKGFEILVSNDGDGDLKVRFNGDDSQEITIANEEVFNKSNFEFSSLDISNNSGETINYRIQVTGI